MGTSGALAASAELEGARQEHTNAQAKLNSDSAQAKTTLRDWYAGALATISKQATASGDLDTVLAITAEKERTDRPLDASERQALPPLLAKVRAQYDQALAEQARKDQVSSRALQQSYVAALEVLEKELTKSGNLDNAIAVREERKLTVAGMVAEVAVSAPAVSRPPATGAGTGQNLAAPKTTEWAIQQIPGRWNFEKGGYAWFAADGTGRSNWDANFKVTWKIIDSSTFEVVLLRWDPKPIRGKLSPDGQTITFINKSGESHWTKAP